MTDGSWRPAHPWSNDSYGVAEDHFGWSRSSYIAKDEVSWVVWTDGEQHYLYGGASGLFGVAVYVLFPLVEEFQSS